MLLDWHIIFEINDCSIRVFQYKVTVLQESIAYLARESIMLFTISVNLTQAYTNRQATQLIYLRCKITVHMLQLINDEAFYYF